jgi:phage replication O-like protein O
VPNWLINQAASLSSASFKVAIVVCRLTLGWQKDEDAISLSQLGKLTDLSKPTLITALRDLAKAGIVENTTPGERSMGTYRLVKNLDQMWLNNLTTGKETLPDLVKKLDTQKKEKEREHESAVALAAEAARAVAQAAPADEPPHPAEALDQQAARPITQASLVGLPSPLPPVAAAPPSPEKPARARAPRKAKASAEQTAIRSALRTAANWGPDAKANAQAATNGDALMTFDPAVTAERIALFARRYFPRFSPVAVAAARRQDTVSAPTPGQVVQYWPSFQEWERAQAAHRLREEQAAPPPAAVVITDEQRRENQRKLQEAQREHLRRQSSASTGSFGTASFGGGGESGHGHVAMVAAGRAR